MIKHASRKYYDYFFRECSKTPSKFRKTIKKIFPTKENSSISFNLTSKADKLLKANSFCSFFSTIAIAMMKAALPLSDLAWKVLLKLEKSNGTPLNSNMFHNHMLKTNLRP